MLFVDWLNCSQQFPAGAYPDFLGGRVVSIDGACGLQRAPVLDRDTGALEEQWSICGGEDELSIEFDSAKFASHRGTYETNLMVRMIGGKLEVRGNPSGFGRLDNVFGYSLDDAIEVYNEVLESLGLPCFTQGEETQIWLQNEEKFHHDYTGVKISRVDLTENHPGEKPVSISGKDVRATLQRGEQVDPRVMRPSTSRILGAAMKTA